ncbi:hypothetical protein ARSEF1564_000396 [Beauveria bassiana]
MAVGNESAAQDLYGLGVRVGFYMQGLAMILYLYGEETNHGKGLKVASGSMTASILASWFVYAAQAKFSPCEALVVLLFLTNLFFPAKITLLNPRAIAGEMIGLAMLIINEVGICTALIWLFSSLVSDLPLLETPSVIYRNTSLCGWFRWVALAYCIVDVLTSFIFIKKVARLLRIAWQYCKSHRLTNDEVDRITHIVQWSGERTLLKAMLWLVFTFITITVEMTIHWNHLSPSADLQAPGQLIPLTTGAILLVDSSFVAGREQIPRLIKYFSKTVSRLTTFEAFLRMRIGIAFILHWGINTLARLLRWRVTDAAQVDKV